MLLKGAVPESEFFAGKTRTETSPSCKEQMFEVNRLFVVCLYTLVLQACNWPMSKLYIYTVYGLLAKREVHSHPQSPQSFCPVAGIENSGFGQLWKRVIHVKPRKSDWLRIRNRYSVHTQKIGSSQHS